MALQHSEPLPVSADGVQRGVSMIQLTRLNNSSITINSDLIKFVEQSPDTVITLLNGEKILVREPVQEILERVVEFRRRVLGGVTWGTMASASALGCEGDETNEG
jgi:flagellar protein FlbD